MTAPLSEFDTGAESASLLAAELYRELRSAAEGHCARVDYLDRQEAVALASALRARAARGGAGDLAVHVLSDNEVAPETDLAISTDRAIELRNRKRGRLCLLVPGEIVHATASSLGNSFAEIDGRELLRRAYRGWERAVPLELPELMRRLRSDLRRAPAPGDAQWLDFALAAGERQANGKADAIGLELWRLGLIPDARPDFAEQIDANRRAVITLARPRRLAASPRERIAALGVDGATAEQLERFFAGRPMHDPVAWTRDIASEPKHPLSFDRWVFPEQVVSDLEAVSFSSFLDRNGVVLKSTKLRQAGGTGGALQAPAGAKEYVELQWRTEPAKPQDAGAWRIALLPASETDADSEGDEPAGLPEREVKASLRRHRFRMDLPAESDEDLEALLGQRFAFRIVALDAAGNELLRDGRPVAAESEEFYLTVEAPAADGTASRPRQKQAATLAEGRLLHALESRDAEIELTQPAWDGGLFTARINEKARLALPLNPLLLDVERRTLAAPRDGGRWTLQVDEIRPALAVEAQPAPLSSREDRDEFWRARTGFFDRLRRAYPRDTIETAEWSTELTNAAVRYAQAWTGLLERATGDELAAALSLDTLTVSVDDGAPAAVVLPTHPLRSLWFAAHALLLRHWEERLLRRDRGERAALLDRALLAELRPANTPLLVTGTDLNLRVYTQQLDVFHALALPAGDPATPARVRAFAEVLGLSVADEPADDLRAPRLTKHLTAFRAMHGYADPLLIDLLNPDRGELPAAALRGLRDQSTAGDDEDTAAPLPALAVAAYTGSGADFGAPLLAAGLLRPSGDHLHPGVSVTVQRLEGSDLAPAHLGIATDLSATRLVARSDSEMLGSSFSVHGLIARLAAEFTMDGDAPRWRHYLRGEQAAGDPHPTHRRAGEALVEGHRALVRAAARLLGGTVTADARAGIEVAIDPAAARLLEQLHLKTDWVITVDRFFGIDYYDSPTDPRLETIARKYLLDYSPEFVEGLGRRIAVTTAWREEVEAVLRRAMREMGFGAVEESAGHVLHLLKTVSGGLALKTLDLNSSAPEAVSLAAVMAWLQRAGRLRNAVLVPVDLHEELFWLRDATSGRRCDLLLVTPRAGMLDVTFIEVKWRAAPLGSIDPLVSEIDEQTRATEQVVRDRFFNPDRVDLALQRSHLTSLLDFYCRRAERYGLLDSQAASTLRQALANLDRLKVTINTRREGYIVCLDAEPRPQHSRDGLTVHVLTSADLPMLSPVAPPPSTLHAPDAPPPQPQPDRDPGAEAQIPTLLPVGNDRETLAAVALAEVQAVGESTPDKAPSEIHIELGMAGGQPVVWQPGVRGSPHLFVTGIPGQGKSVLITNLLIDLARQGVPALVLDFHGQIGDREGPYAKAAGPLVLDALDGLPFSPFEIGTDEDEFGWKGNVYAIADIFQYVCGLGMVQRDTLYTCLSDAYRSRGYGESTATGGQGFPSLHEVLARVEAAEQRGHTGNLLARCRPLLELDIFRPDEHAEGGFAEGLRRGLVVDLHRLYADTLQHATGAFLLRKVYREMFGWGMADHLRLAIVLDEAHRLARDVTLPKIMKEGRKFGVAVVVASQGLADFHADVVGNAGTKVAFRANNPESRKIARFFPARRGRDLTADLESLSVGEALVHTPSMAHAARVRMRPPG